MTAARTTRMALMLVLALWASCKAERGPGQVVVEFVAATQGRDWSQAYGLTTTAYQRLVTPTEFRAGIEARPYLVEATGFRVQSVASLEAGKMLVQGLLRSGGEVPCTAVLERSGGQWRLSELWAPAEPLIPVPVP